MSECQEPVPCRECGAAIYPGQDFCSEQCEREYDYDPTPCCHQHGTGSIGTNEPCPEIADND